MFIPQLDEIRLVQVGRVYTGFAYTEPNGNKKTGKAATRPVRFPKEIGPITTKEEAKAQIRAWHVAQLSAAQAMAEEKAPVLTFSEIFVHYRKLKPSVRLAENSTFNFRTKAFEAEYGSHPATDWTRDFVHEEIVPAMSEEYADTTIRLYTQSVHWAVMAAYDDRLLPDDYRLPKNLDLPSADVRNNFLSHEDEQKLWDYAVATLEDPDTKPHIYDYALFTCIALETAGRAKAIEELEWHNGQIDFRSETIHLHHPQRKETTKHRASVWLSERLRPVLERAKQRTNSHRVFQRQIHYHAFRRFIKGAELGNPLCSRHDLRRTWATLHAMEGVDLIIIANQLGDSISVVEKHYLKYHRNQRVRSQLNQRFMNMQKLRDHQDHSEE